MNFFLFMLMLILFGIAGSAVIHFYKHELYVLSMISLFIDSIIGVIIFHAAFQRVQQIFSSWW